MPQARPHLRTLAPFALLALAGCKFGWTDTGEDEDNPVKTHSHDFAATSLVLSANGDLAIMSTSAGVVAFDTSSGQASASTPAGDFVEPKVEDWIGDKVAIIERSVDGGVFLWEPGVPGYELREDEDAGANASSAIGFSGGLAWIGRRAENCRIFRDGLDLATIEPCGRVRELDVVRADGTLFLGYDDELGTESVQRIDPDGSQATLDVPMDHISWDNVRQVLYTASADSTLVEAVTAEGGPVFSVELDDPIVDLVALEQRGLLAVLTVAGADAYVHIIDQYTGAEVKVLDAASATSFMAASADSSTLALVQAERMVILEVDWAALLAPSDTQE